MCKKILTLLLVAVSLILLPHPAYAQEPTPEGPLPVVDWQELPTQYFIIVYANGITLQNQPVDCPACGIDPAQQYAAFIDKIYADQVAVFNTQLQIPLNLRLFPTEESYFQVNPLAKDLPGVLAHTMNDQSEIAIALTRTENLGETDLTNNIRHEIAHLFASALSDGKLNTGFQEGIAQYLEQPDIKTEKKQDLLRQTFDQEQLLTWAQLDNAEQFYSNPQVAYPQSLSIVSFLIDRYGLVNFIKFIKASATEPGYRSALEATYGKPADSLETEWKAYLPQYFAGRWQINAVYTYDLSRVTELVNNGAYTDAGAELAEVITLLQTTEQQATLAEAQALMERIQHGKTAGLLADQTYQALQAGDYDQVINKGNAAIQAYQQVGYTERIPEIQTYMHRATIGQDALERLNHGEELLNSLFFLFEAENELYEATVLLQSLGNQAAAQRGIDLLNESVQRQRILAYGLLGVGTVILFFNGLRRLYNWFSANPLEVELS
ncbi:MAG: hypothetical protein JXM69_11080 [Anaerolineae bacterium]|nr:hypothetical protein [Anaerolineae bacterium]